MGSLALEDMLHHADRHGRHTSRSSKDRGSFVSVQIVRTRPTMFSVCPVHWTDTQCVTAVKDQGDETAECGTPLAHLFGVAIFSRQLAASPSPSLIFSCSATLLVGYVCVHRFIFCVRENVPASICPVPPEINALDLWGDGSLVFGTSEEDTCRKRAAA